VKVRLIETDGADEVALIFEDLEVPEESPEISKDEQEA